MSHVTAVKLRVENLDALEEAAAKLGLVLKRGQNHYAWYGRDMRDSNLAGNHDRAKFGKCEHALRRLDHQQGDYEIGIVKATDGSEAYEMLFDEWGPGQKLVAAVEKNANALKREYAAEVATRKANEKLGRHGFKVVREDLPNRAIRLKVKKR